MVDGEMKELTLEIRVGLLILAAGALLATFVFGMGGSSAFTEGKTLYVDFADPGLLKAGAPVRIGSVAIGHVDNIHYRGGDIEEEVGRPVVIRVRMIIEPSFFEGLHEDARVVVGMKNAMGEGYALIDPGTADAPLLENGAVLIGQEPASLTRTLAPATEMLGDINEIVRDNRENIDTLIASAASSTRQIDGLVERHGDRVDRIIDNIEQIMEEGNELSDGVTRLANSPRIDRIGQNIDGISGSIDEHVDPLRTSVESLSDKGETLLADVWGEDQQAQVDQMLEAAPVILDDIDVIAGDVREVVAQVEGGRGSIGALMNDNELLDEMQEMVRDLKHNPWRLFWME